MSAGGTCPAHSCPGTCARRTDENAGARPRRGLHILDTAGPLHVILDPWQMLIVPVTPLVLSGGT
jgi:hypothetical protein